MKTGPGEEVDGGTITNFFEKIRRKLFDANSAPGGPTAPTPQTSFWESFLEVPEPEASQATFDDVKGVSSYQFFSPNPPYGSVI